jgi:hypothetical protein
VLLIKGAASLIGGLFRLATVPVLLVGGVIAAVAVAAPLLPVLLIALLIWVVARASSRPAAV